MAGGMTPETLETEWLSLESWLRDCVAPVALGLLFILLLIFAMGMRGTLLDLLAGSLGMVALFLCGLQAIDRMTAQMLHRDLLRRSPYLYRARLAAVAQEPTRARDIFRLIAWIDEDLQA